MNRPLEPIYLRNLRTLATPKTIALNEALEHIDYLMSQAVDQHAFLHYPGELPGLCSRCRDYVSTLNGTAAPRACRSEPNLHDVEGT